jgi:hypothetical protein
MTLSMLCFVVPVFVMPSCVAEEVANYGAVMICGNNGWFPAETCVNQGVCQIRAAGNAFCIKKPESPPEPATLPFMSPRPVRTRVSERPTASAPSPAAARSGTARLSARPSAAVV